MKKILMTASALALGATAATAGGIERSSQSTAILFEKGNYAEFNLGGFNPSVSGINTSTRLGVLGASSGDMAGNYTTYSFGYKQALNGKLDVAVILDQPIGADVDYAGATDYPVGGTTGATASIESTAITALLRYKLPSNFSVLGGLRAERASGKVSLAFPINYTMTSTNETDLGYVVGAAWEKPEIAARVALTYNSKITHEFSYTEATTSPFSGINGPSAQQVTVPESVNLEFQTGIAKDTLLMGSVRWVHWTQFDITPPNYAPTVVPGVGPLGPLVKYTSNTTSYSLGVGRKFNEQWSGAVMLGYEKGSGEQVGNLGPTDGFRSIGFAASYKPTENLKITAGIRYVDIGDAVTRGILGNFTDNSGWGGGVRISMNF